VGRRELGTRLAQPDGRHRLGDESWALASHSLTDGARRAGQRELGARLAQPGGRRTQGDARRAFGLHSLAVQAAAVRVATLRSASPPMRAGPSGTADQSET